ncbi:MAG TPA: amylo-alpha-1,6-glucosidase [Caulobacteraceae bacterium]|nr:amylo-alpha-1,6-glucosidase [Caulobacteraceae bacterium]
MDDNAGTELAATEAASAVALEPEETSRTSDPSQLLSLKDGETFLVADNQGDLNGGSDGLFVDDTRILSRFRLLLGEKRPSRLSFGLSHDNAVFTFHGANLALPPVGGRATPRGVIHVERRRCLWQGRLMERVRLTNFGLDEVMVPLAFEYAADFRDMFEVRGLRRRARGRLDEPRCDGRRVTFDYEGLDGRQRRGVVGFSEPPWRMDRRRADFMFTLAPDRRFDLFIEAGMADGEPPSRERFGVALKEARDAVHDRRGRGGQVTAPDGAFHSWLEQSRADVAVLTTDLPTGPYPFAGIPWFCTTFGRDGIITAWQMLWLDPSLAAGVLRRLAATQATELSDFRDSAPGKILHEARRGEMAALKEVPFGQYYGGVDTTPLFVALAGAYLQRTDDVRLIAELWPHLKAAMDWVETYGDSNGDGFVDYARGAETGLSNQGWKDSEDSVFHADGRFPVGPVALVEVQGYVFAACQAMAQLAERLGERGAEAWRAKAEDLRTRVERAFWMEDQGFYAIAVDGEGRVCEPHTSNPGHLLFVGLPSPERAQAVTRRLLSAEFDSGWGVRTLAMAQARYNPMSYHNGSIWPHDTALCVAGMARYGEREGVAKVMLDLFQAACSFGMRMPELFCGFPREGGEPPIAYPVACLPQAWAAGSAFMMLQACLGLSVDASRREIRLTRPTLPPGIHELTVTGLPIGEAEVDIRFQRLGEGVAVTPTQDGGPPVAVVLEG